MGKLSFTKEWTIWLTSMQYNIKKHYYEVESWDVCSIFGKKQVMVVCVQCAFHMNETSEPNRQTGNIILQKWSLSLKTNVMQQKKDGG